jgi:prevent-host-death family protein
MDGNPAMKKRVSATEARAHFGRMMREVAEDGATYIVDHRGKPKVVVVSPEEYEKLQGAKANTIDWLEQLRSTQAAFRPLRESGRMPDIVELIREEREKRDQQILDAVYGRYPEDMGSN